MRTRAVPMSPASPSLRRTVAQLQKVPPDDFEAILETLNADQRRRVLVLLGDLQGQSSRDTSSDEAVSFAEIVLPSGLSPWLIARINGSGDGGDETADQFSMTEYAHKMLRQCAAELAPQPAPSSVKPSLASRLGRLFA